MVELFKKPNKAYKNDAFTTFRDTTVAVALAADAATGSIVGTIANEVKNCADIVHMVTAGKKPTLGDAATIVNQVPILGHIVKTLNLGKQVVENAARGDDKACYRNNWSMAKKDTDCGDGRSKFLGVVCMDDCPLYMPLCPGF